MANGATPLYCSDVQLPASGSGHDTDLSQVTTLQYCIIDNCTILRIDTGQQLDIVYTTESLLIVTPKDGHTSMVITKIDNELPCLGYHNASDTNLNISNCPTCIDVEFWYSNYPPSLQGSLYQFVWTVTHVLQSCYSDHRLWYRLPSINTLLDNS